MTIFTSVLVSSLSPSLFSGSFSLNFSPPLCRYYSRDLNDSCCISSCIRLALTAVSGCKAIIEHSSFIFITIQNQTPFDQYSLGGISFHQKISMTKQCRRREVHVVAFGKQVFLLLLYLPMEASQWDTPKNTVSLYLRKEAVEITLSSNFDSGNMAKAELGLSNAIVITPAQDCAQFDNPSHSKGWFYFTVSGPSYGSKLKFVIKKMSPLATQLKFGDYFRPVFCPSGEEWQRLEHAIVFTKQDDTELHFDFTFQKSSVSFAYSYPFSYESCELMLKQISKEVKTLKNIYYRDEIMIRSPQGRAVHLLTLSSHDHKAEEQEQRINPHLFGQAERPHEFKQKKIVLITARVHPGQSPSSHVFNGILKFLISNDARAHLLRKNFVFKLVPMLNPDGVFHGHYRMDSLGQNLNRFYIDPDFYRQPSVFAVKTIGEHYSATSRLCFYMDLHAHPQKKGNFIYGNSMDSPALQVETQLFAKLLSLNCIEFDYPNSTFSKYHMNAKDKNEDMTKQGAGRVVFHTHLKTTYAYTLECGYTCSNYLNAISSIQNSHRKFQKHPILSDELENIKSNYYFNKKNLYFTIRSYQNLGKNIAVSILDLHELNPASRVPHSPMKSLGGVRQEIMSQLNKISMSYKIARTPLTVGGGKASRPSQEQKKRGHLFRAPSIQSSKEMQLGKVRNRTLAKVNIGVNF